MLCCLVVFLFCVYGSGMGSAGDSIVHPLNLIPQQGLAAFGKRTINVLLKDHKGFLWIGTDKGLLRYDGVSARSYFHSDDDTSSIPDNQIVSIAEDANGNIWAGTQAGVYVLDSTGYHGKTCPGSSSYGNNHVFYISGKVWLGNPNGFFTYNDRRRSFVKLLPYFVKAMTKTTGDTLVLACDHLLMFMHSTSSSVFLLKPLKSVVTSLIFTQNRICLGTWGDGLQIYSTKGDLKQQLVWDKKQNSFGTRNIIKGICGKENELYLATESGVSKLWLNTMGMEPLGLPPGFVTTVYLEGNSLWIGDESGLYLHKTERPSVSYYPVDGDVQDVVRIGERFFVSTWYGKGLMVFDENMKLSGTLARVPVHSPDQECRQVNGVCTDRFHNIWISTLGGLTVYDSTMKLLKTYNSEEQGGLTYHRTNSLFYDGSSVWVANYHKGLDRIDEKTGGVTHYPPDKLLAGDGLCWCFFKDKAGRLWIGGNSGLMVFLNGNFVAAPGVLKGRPYQVHGINQSPDGRLWVATSIGLFAYDTDRSEYQKVPFVGEYNTDILDVQPDDRGRIWFTDGSSVVGYDPARAGLLFLTEEDGLDPDYQINKLYFCKPYLYLGQKERIARVHLGRLNASSSKLAVYITEIQVNDSLVMTGGCTKGLDFTYWQNRIRINFTAPSFHNARTIHYFYQLLPLSDKWINIGNDQHVYFSGLAPGRYTFRVKAVNSLGEASPLKEVAFSVEPPFWRTWWFALLLVVLAMSIIYAWYRFRMRRMLALQEIRDRISRDLHDDVGAGLSTIAVLSRLAGNAIGTSSADTAELLGKVSQQAMQLNDNMHDIVWSVNAENDSFEHLFVRMRSVAAELLEAAGIEAHFEADASLEQDVIGMGDRHDFYMIFKEALTNVVKYAEAENVYIRLQKHQGRVLFSLTDDGKGFTPESVKEGNGLLNMQNRAKRLKARLEIESSPGKGCRIHLII